ncbi:MAG: hypothetical protein M0P29_13915 [Sphaerochaetaceae bacterium]|nr:hypothetical protein [Sphaerochaetaceae bacterium]
MYLTRFADSMLQERLNSAGAVLIRGPKGCGKTETAMQKAKSIARMDIDESVRIRMEIDPKLVLQGEVPRLIDNGRNIRSSGIMSGMRWIQENRRVNLFLPGLLQFATKLGSIQGLVGFQSLPCAPCHYSSEVGPQAK